MPLWLRLCDFLLLAMYITLGWILSSFTQLYDWSTPAVVLGAIAYGIFMIVTLNWILSSLPKKYSYYFTDEYKKNKSKTT